MLIIGFSRHNLFLHSVALQTFNLIFSFLQERGL